ncbi:hypothetical protein HZA45_03105 [Candidatus Peregrinibacteria bacterium]|nr:hypothetical protein [Candidatus Peregrinibacteria bacterium]
MSETPPSHPTTIDEKLDRIVTHLDHMNRRDKLRMWGSLIHGIIGFIPTLILLGTVWYVYNNASNLLTTMASEAAKQAAVYSESSFTKQFQQYFQK